VKAEAVKSNIKVKLLPGWIDASKDNPDGPASFLRESSKSSGAVQVSHAEYARGAVPNPSEQDLIVMSRAFGTGTDMNLGDVGKSQSGGCTFGKFGTTVYRSAEFPRSQVWYLSDGKDFIMVTHICGEEPDPQELVEVDQIVHMLTLGPPDKPQWKFW
jgi:hypothetical protein